MKKNFILIISIVFFVFNLNAQKKPKKVSAFLIKTDITSWALDNAINAELEWKCNAINSLSIGFSSGGQFYPQYYQESQYANWKGADYGDKAIFMPDKGIVNSTQVNISWRWYKDRVIEAPFGWYSYLSVGSGFADLSGEYDEFLFDKKIQRGGLGPVKEAGPGVSYRFINVPFVKLSYGKGYQWFLTPNLCFDAGIYAEWNCFLMHNHDEALEVSGLTRNFGNKLSLIAFPGGGLGVSGYIKMSYLMHL